MGFQASCLSRRAKNSKNRHRQKECAQPGDHRCTNDLRIAHHLGNAESGKCNARRDVRPEACLIEREQALKKRQPGARPLARVCVVMMVVGSALCASRPLRFCLGARDVHAAARRTIAPSGLPRFMRVTGAVQPHFHCIRHQQPQARDLILPQLHSVASFSLPGAAFSILQTLTWCRRVEARSLAHAAPPTIRRTTALQYTTKRW